MISFLDLATTSGVAWGVPNGRPEFDTWRLASHEGRGRIGLNLMMKLRRHIDEVKPSKIFIEAPMMSRGQIRKGATMETTLMLQGLIFTAEMVALSRSIPTELIERQDILAHFTGRRMYPERTCGKDAAKKAVMSRCTSLRWSPANYDEADAGAGWFTACGYDNPRMAIAMGLNAPARITRRKAKRTLL